MKNEKIQKLLNAANRVGNYLLLVVCLCAGFFIGRVSHQILPKEDKVDVSTKSLNSISIAINESNDLLLIDRSTGKYDVFADSVGFTIFRMYAGKISQTVNQSK